MAKKNRSRRQRQRVQGTVAPPAQGLGEPSAGQSGVAAPAAPRPAAARPQPFTAPITGPRRAAAATATTGTIDIDTRVPYFTSDLRRIALTAGVMLAIIIIASFVVH